jgi:aryl-alcohol dehydrogenase-like predicted oxidoreductase
MRLALGTAQFGSAYGVSNIIGQPSFLEVRRILDSARKQNFKILDTAATYGNSEELLGRIGVSDWQVVTKIPPITSSIDDPENWIIDQVKLSMSRLGVDSLYGVLLHKPEDLLKDSSGGYLRALERLRYEGKVSYVGYSIYSPNKLELLTKLFWPDIIQTPFNVFDQRIRTSGWLNKFSEKGTKVFGRSAFLQGLLLMDSDSRPNYFSPWSSLFKRWDYLIKQYGISPLQASLGFVLQEKAMSSFVVGVESEEQLSEIVSVINQTVPIEDFKKLNSNDERLIEPFRWNL